MTPKEWVDKTLGKKIDTDNFPAGNPFQCWDYFDYFCRTVGFTGSRYCASTGYVGDLWLLRDCDGYEYYRDFEYITDPTKFKDGDWLFWEKHIAMYYDGLEVGQNQPNPWVTEKEITNWGGILGAMRYKYWDIRDIPYNHSFVEINGHQYSVFRNSPVDQIAVLAAGINQVAALGELDADDILISARIMGANYFQMKEDQADPVNTTYGDVSAPLSGVYQCVPNQDTTLFYDLDTGEFGDCTGVVINSAHNVFSPSLIFPNSKGNWEYARMVGLDLKDYRSYYTFLVRFADGYALGRAVSEMTPQEIADDWQMTDMINIAFLDGGGSAQAAFWYDGDMHYERDTGRLCPSELISYRKFETVTPVIPAPEPEPTPEPDIPVIVPKPEDPDAEVPETPEPEVPDVPETPETPEKPEKEEEDNMTEYKPIDGWTDPEYTKSISERISSLLSVKSIVTLMLTIAFVILTVSGKDIPQGFTYIYTMCISFFFGCQFTKGSNTKNGK